MKKSYPEDLSYIRRIVYATFGADATVKPYHEKDTAFRAEVKGPSGVPTIAYGETEAQALAALVIKRLELFQG